MISDEAFLNKPYDLLFLLTLGYEERVSDVDVHGNRMDCRLDLNESMGTFGPSQKLSQ